MHRFARFRRDERAQDLIEYALIAGFISMVAIIGVTRVGTGVNDSYTSIATGLRPGPVTDPSPRGPQIQSGEPATTAEPCRAAGEVQRSTGCRSGAPAR